MPNGRLAGAEPFKKILQVNTECRTMPAMDKRQRAHLDDVTLSAAKRERQARSRLLVQTGVRTQESMYLIAPSLAKAAKVRHRVLSF